MPPSPIVDRRWRTVRAALSLRNVTLPSPRTALVPPGCKLPHRSQEERLPAFFRGGRTGIHPRIDPGREVAPVLDPAAIEPGRTVAIVDFHGLLHHRDGVRRAVRDRTDFRVAVLAEHRLLVGRQGLPVIATVVAPDDEIVVGLDPAIIRRARAHRLTVVRPVLGHPVPRIGRTEQDREQS